MFLAPKDNTNRNEPWLSRHARAVHQLARKVFRLAFLGKMNQVHAAGILEPLHERRSRALGNESSADILNDLAIEDMRRGIHQVFLATAVWVLMVAAAVAFVGDYFGAAALWHHTDDMTRIYVSARGLPKASAVSVVEQALSQATRPVAPATDEPAQPEHGLRAWVHHKLENRIHPQDAK